MIEESLSPEKIPTLEEFVNKELEEFKYTFKIIKINEEKEKEFKEFLKEKFKEIKEKIRKQNGEIYGKGGSIGKIFVIADETTGEILSKIKEEKFIEIFKEEENIKNWVRTLIFKVISKKIEI